MSARAWSGLLAASIAMGSSGVVLAQTGSGLSIELNKLEPNGGGCRAYFVAENRMRETVKEIALDTFVFDPAGVITRRVGLTFPDIRAGRTKVVPFDLSAAGCGEIKRLLVNEIIGCTGATGAPLAGCAEALSVASRAPASFEY